MRLWANCFPLTRTAVGIDKVLSCVRVTVGWVNASFLLIWLLSVLLLHGFPLSGAMWTPQIAALESDRRILAPDARGVGTSDIGSGQYTMEMLVDDLFAVLDRVAAARPIVACTPSNPAS